MYVSNGPLYWLIQEEAGRKVTLSPADAAIDEISLL